MPVKNRSAGWRIVFVVDRKAWIVGAGGQLFDPSDHTAFRVLVQALNVISGSA